jgi:hypothetical protein
VSTGWLRIRLFDYCRACFLSGTARSDSSDGEKGRLLGKKLEAVAVDPASNFVSVA